MDQPRMIRWSFHVATWKPTPELIQTLLTKIPAHERTKIKRFRFPMDARRALIGQLIARAAVMALIPAPSREKWADVKVERDKYGKPFLSFPDIPHLLFNISHHGDWVIVAAGYGSQLGVDVSRFEKPTNETLDEYFAAFDEIFTPNEWGYINGETTQEGDGGRKRSARAEMLRKHTLNAERLRRFVTLWALKESFVKAIGIGLGLDLMRVEFCVKDADKNDAAPGHALHDDIAATPHITVSLDNIPQAQYTFHMSYLDSYHPAAYCYLPVSDNHTSEDTAVGSSGNDGRNAKDGNMMSVDHRVNGRGEGMGLGEDDSKACAGFREMSWEELSVRIEACERG
ncbi:uncharacterized protein EV422DRAFT_532305 [Fimicolochytrium jonesii]|uniref:uncharacterized protein n=1 Tax=Fimicolochytrium jonesii TaxID=1396493 RepID=UPI0022FE5C8F|nr:uncharacterized protein EV422DRAFT_532305 [Fimicolochytrium jonesii]KAI8820290.1 hypothetical protein EV422DRAFT_532305 [Fimicolochytrium jonesii]